MRGTRINEYNSIYILVSQNHPPLKRTNPPWRNYWFHSRVLAPYKMSLELLMGPKSKETATGPVGDREACGPEPRLKRAPALSASPQFPRGPAGQEHLFQLFRRSWKSRLDVNDSNFLMLAINSKKCESQGQTKHVSWLNWDVTSDWIQLSSFCERGLEMGEVSRLESTLGWSGDRAGTG